MTRRSLTVAWLGVGVGIALGVWGWSFQPDRPVRWALVALFLPGLWGFLELMQGGNLDSRRVRLMAWHRAVIGWVGLVMAVGIGSRLAIAVGWLDPGWAPVAWRAKGIVLGGGLAIWGNYLPKLMSPWDLENEPFDWRGVHRFCGWVATICGIALAGSRAFLPMETARVASPTIAVTFVVLCLGRKLFSVATHSPESPPTRRTPLTP